MKENEINESSCRSKITVWADVLERHQLPSYDELPELELYMDQVIILTNQYLNHLEPLVGEDKPVTPAMINNYVKMKLISPPVKKRYRRSQLACIIMICLLKRSLTMSAIQKLMPANMTDEDAEKLYRSFTRNRAVAINYVVSRVRSWNDEIFEAEDEDDKAFIIRLASMASLFKTSAEKLVDTEPDNKSGVKEKDKDR